MKKAIVLDLDGTLFNNQKEVSEFNRDVLRKCRDNGFLIIIATARPLRTVLRRIPSDFRDDYLVLCNGAWVVRNGEVAYRDEMPAHMVRSIVSELLDIGLAPSIEANDCFYTDGERDPGFIGSYFPLGSYPGVDACKVLSYSKTGIDHDRVMQMFGDTVSPVITDSGTLLQVSSKTCSKLNACLKILGDEGVSLADTFAFGDDNNDLSIFEAVGCGIAMANSTVELQRVAKHVAASNDEDGVGKGILKYVLATNSDGRTLGS
jgi:Cof subfamily protein (haloacid dehalogenase superfamily)